MPYDFKARMLSDVDAKIAQRDWSAYMPGGNLSNTSIMLDATRMLNARLNKERLFPKSAIKQRIKASKAQTLFELRAAIEEI